MKHKKEDLCIFLNIFRNLFCINLVFILNVFIVDAQDTKRSRPEEWNNLVVGGRFIDRFQPISPMGKLVVDTWGAKEVKPRYIDNGIEDSKWSYWGGNIRKGEDNKYHLIVCRWPENAPKGHMNWPNSLVVHAVADNSMGPYKIVGETIGEGHNPEYFRINDGRYVIYVTGAYYISESIQGPWEKKKFNFDPRDRRVIEGLSNVSFAQRPDGSYIAVCRGGGMWISKTGISDYCQVTNKSVYPGFDGRYEDPVIWRTNIQYHMIVNDWYGRIAYHLRSKNGIEWKVDPGEAYMPGITEYTDGTVENWYKYERIKMLQDEQGRAVQANFAVIDSSKWHDLPNDHHSSKNICIPLVKGKLLTVLNNKKISSKTKKIKVEIKAEKEFDPFKDMDLESLRFGAPEVVDFGGGCKLLESKKRGNDLILIFEGKGNGFTEDNFAGKLIGKTSDKKLLFGYARLPWVSYREPILTARRPNILSKNGENYLQIKVQNYGLSKSKKVRAFVELKLPEKIIKVNGNIPVLDPYEKDIVEIKIDEDLEELTGLCIKAEGQNMPLFTE